MINISNDFKNNLKGARNITAKLKLTFSDATTIYIYDDDIINGGIIVNDAISSRNALTVGNAIVNGATFYINNRGDKYTKYNLDNIKIDLYIGSIVGNTTEWIQKGAYIVNNATYQSGNLIIECFDYMSKLDAYTLEAAGVSLPASLFTIIQKICTKCGVNTNISTFANKDLVVNSVDISGVTCREALAYIVMIAGKNARFSNTGVLEFVGFGGEIHDLDYNGGEFDANETTYTSGDTLNGGYYDDANPYASGASASGGNFADRRGYHNLYNNESEDISADAVTFTGVKVKAQGTTSDYGETYLYGVEGYIMELSNPFIEEGNAQTVADEIGASIVGVSVRPMTIELAGNPSIEAGDICKVTDYKGQVYEILATTLEYNITNSMTIRCDAATPTHNSAARLSADAQNVLRSKQAAKQQITVYDAAVQRLTALITQSFGAFKSEEVQSDGSIIYYMHNKPTRAESMTIWKMTADAFAVSTDGGQTWNAGIDSSGNALVNVLNALGINADWINAGTLRSRQIINTGTITKYASDYSQTDIDRIMYLIFGGSADMTANDFEKYDLTGDGILDIYDLEIVTQLANNTISKYEVEIEATIGNGSINKCIYIHDKTKDSGVIIGYNGINCSAGKIGDLRADTLNQMSLNKSGSFITADGKHVSFEKGIITEFY